MIVIIPTTWNLIIFLNSCLFLNTQLAIKNFMRPSLRVFSIISPSDCYYLNRRPIICHSCNYHYFLLKSTDLRFPWIPFPTEQKFLFQKMYYIIFPKFCFFFFFCSSHDFVDKVFKPEHTHLLWQRRCLGMQPKFPTLPLFHNIFQLVQYWCFSDGIFTLKCLLSFLYSVNACTRSCFNTISGEATLHHSHTVFCCF